MAVFFHFHFHVKKPHFDSFLLIKGNEIHNQSEIFFFPFSESIKQDSLQCSVEKKKEQERVRERTLRKEEGKDQIDKF